LYLVDTPAGPIVALGLRSLVKGTAIAYGKSTFREPSTNGVVTGTPINQSAADEAAAPPAGVDVDLVQRAQVGDPSALNELCRRTWVPVYRYLAAHTDSPAEAEDLTQSVYLRVLKSLPTYEARGVPFEVYLIRAARNLLVDRWRSSRGPSIPLDSVEEQLSFEPGPELVMDAQETSTALQLAFGQLSMSHQEVLRLRIVDGLSSGEVATRLGSTGPAVRQMQVRAISALREAVRVTAASATTLTASRKE
jgi:RNA polymerase sigma-70 factor (ECF subfamily)